MSALLTDVEVAEKLAVDLTTFHTLRRRNQWPCVHLGRTIWRFTPEQVDHIIAAHTTATAHQSSVSARPIKGQTARSAARGQR